jgi:hypothetical protein
MGPISLRIGEKRSSSVIFASISRGDYLPLVAPITKYGDQAFALRR